MLFCVIDDDDDDDESSVMSGINTLLICIFADNNCNASTRNGIESWMIEKW